MLPVLAVIAVVTGIYIHRKRQRQQVEAVSRDQQGTSVSSTELETSELKIEADSVGLGEMEGMFYFLLFALISDVAYH